MENQKKESEISRKYNNVIAELGKLGEFTQLVELQKPAKVNADVLATVISELVEEARTKNAEDVKNQFRDLALAKAALDKELRKLRQDYEKAEDAKKKEFTDKAAAAMAQIELRQKEAIEQVNDLLSNTTTE